MDAKVLETTPIWILYPFLASCGLFLVSCRWVCGVHILAAFHVPRVPYRRLPGYILTIVLTACAVIVFWFLFSMMFVRFHTVLIGSDRIDLVYCWPRPNLSLNTADLRSADIHMYPRRKGGRIEHCRLEIYTDRDGFRSVDSDQIDVAKQIKQAVDGMTKR